MKAETPHYRRTLIAELQKRIEKNPRYSIRAFAVSIGIESSSLSQILNGSRTISSKLVERIFSNLELSMSEQKSFVDSLIEEKKKIKTGRVNGRLQAKSFGLQKALARSKIPEKGISSATFQLIPEWYHAAIMELTFSPHFQSNCRWIAKRLNISEAEAKIGFEQLLSLGLITKKDDKYFKTTSSIQTSDQSKTTAFHKRRQRQILMKSIESLENDPIEERNHSGITLCLDPAQIPAAKERIQKFLWNLSAQLETGSPRRVYELGVYLFPLQKKENV